MGVAPVDALDQLGDRPRLVSLRSVVGDELEPGHGGERLTAAGRRGTGRSPAEGSRDWSRGASNSSPLVQAGSGVAWATL